MKIKEINASLSGVIATGSYQNLRPGLSVTADLAEGEDPQEACKTLRDMLRMMFKEEEQQAIIERIQREREDLRFMISPDSGKLLPSVTSIINYDADFFVSPQDLVQYASQGNCIDARVKEYIKSGKWVQAKDIKDLWTDIVILTKGNLKLPLDAGDFPGFLKKFPIDNMVVGERFFDDKLGYTGEGDLTGTPVFKEANPIPSMVDVKRTADKLKNGMQLAAYCKAKGLEQGIIVPLNSKTGQGFSKPIVYSKEALEGYFKMFQKKQVAFKKRYGV